MQPNFKYWNKRNIDLFEVEGIRYVQNRAPESLGEPIPFIDDLVKEIVMFVTKQIEKQPNASGKVLTKEIIKRGDELPRDFIHKKIKDMKFVVELRMSKSFEDDLLSMLQSDLDSAPSFLEKVADLDTSQPREHPVITVYLYERDLLHYQERLYAALEHEIHHANDMFLSHILSEPHFRYTTKVSDALKEMYCTDLLNDLDEAFLKVEREDEQYANCIKRMMMPQEIGAYLHTYLGKMIKRDGVNKAARRVEDIFSKDLSDKDIDKIDALESWIRFTRDPNFIFSHLYRMPTYNLLDVALEIMKFKDYYNQIELIRFDLCKILNLTVSDDKKIESVTQIPDLRGIRFTNKQALSVNSSKYDALRKVLEDLRGHATRVIVTYLTSDGMSNMKNAIKSVKKIFSNFSVPVSISESDKSLMQYRKALFDSLFENFMPSFYSHNLFIIP